MVKAQCLWDVAIKMKSDSLFFMVVEMGKACYQCGHNAQYSGFKLATSTFVLSTVYLFETILITNL